MENLNVKVEGNQKKLIVLVGEALTPREPATVKINGSITAPRLYLEKRTPTLENDTIIYSRSQMCIAYRKNELDSLGANIEGKLLMSPDLEKLNINDDKNAITPKEMGALLKRNRFFFKDKEGHASLVSALNTFQATITTEIEKHQDNKGNRHDLVNKAVKANVPTGFVLELPIFIGQKSFSFNVEICFDSTDVSVKCWLESSELVELILGERDAIMDKELADIRAICDMPIIEKI